VDLLPISQPAVSQHLRRLKQGGFVEEYRQKSWTYYHLRDDMSPSIAAWIRALEVDHQDAMWLATHQVEATCAVKEIRTEGLVDAGAGVEQRNKDI
jgi:ArsR family transcriptional regulator